jgi:hypothetical protein
MEVAIAVGSVWGLRQASRLPRVLPSVDFRANDRLFEEVIHARCASRDRQPQFLAVYDLCGTEGQKYGWRDHHAAVGHRVSHRCRTCCRAQSGTTSRFRTSSRLGSRAASQYGGTVGGIALCQETVSVTYASRRAVLIGQVMYLPEAADEEHRDLADVPEEVPFASEPQLAGIQQHRPHAAGIRVVFVIHISNLEP